MKALQELIASSRAPFNSLLLFGYLQALDLLSTLVFLMSGVSEGNPLVRSLMMLAGNPIAGLVWAKVVALALGVCCWLRNRHKLLARVNALYAVVIVWNMVAIIVARTGQ